MNLKELINNGGNKRTEFKEQLPKNVIVRLGGGRSTYYVLGKF